jgi:septal ring factor EnvC (AmiA/AmiB activator)
MAGFVCALLRIICSFSSALRTLQLGGMSAELKAQRAAGDAQQQQRQKQMEEVKSLTSEIAVLTALLASVKEDK